jgi:selenocysteine-specific elongation factor
MRSIVVGTAGHIDHGKSALVLALTGTDPDRLKEEKARGITIDLGFAHATIGGVHFAFVDVPGHERFVKNMLAGVGGIDLVVLVVAADESVMPQTREHFDICRLLHVPVGIVALTKADLADAETLEIARLETRELVAGSFLEGAPMVPVSARDGTGLDAFREALVAASTGIVARSVHAATRLPIDRVFSMKGFGTVVTGTLVSGRIAAERDLVILPGGRPVKVRSVQVHGQKAAEAVAGQRTAINLGGIEVHEIERGQCLVTPGAFVETRVADAVLEVLPGAKPIRHGARVRFHQGTAEILGRVALVTGTAAAGGARTFVRLRFETPAVLGRGDRYILRAYSPPMTIAGGVILDPAPPARTRIRTPAAAERFAALDIAASRERTDIERPAAVAMIRESGAEGFRSAALAWRLGVAPERVDATVAALVAAGDAVASGDVLVAPEVLTRLKEAIVAALAEHHRTQPLSDGASREELRTQLFERGHAAVFDRAVAELADAGRVAGRDRLALAAHRVALSPDEDRVHAAIAKRYLEGGLKPPDAAAVAASGPPAVVDRMLKLLLRQRVLVRLDDLLFHESALKALKAEVAGIKSGAGSTRIDVAMFKERFGVSRKFAIPLLEYLDRERVTRRVGDARVIL